MSAAAVRTLETNNFDERNQLTLKIQMAIGEKGTGHLTHDWV